MDHAAADARRLPLAVIASHRRDMTGKASQTADSQRVREPTQVMTLGLAAFTPIHPAHHLAHAGPPTATWPLGLQKDDLMLGEEGGLFEPCEILWCKKKRGALTQQVLSPSSVGIPPRHF